MPCDCGSYERPHWRDRYGCFEHDDGDDYTADHRADDPRRGQAKDLNDQRP